MLFRDQAEPEVVESNDGDAVFFAQAILNIVGDGIGHEERPGDFKKHGLLDGLDVAPVVAVAVAKIAEPATAGPGFEDHRHRRSVEMLVLSAKLLDQSGKGIFQRGTHSNLLNYLERKTFDAWNGECHVFSFFWSEAGTELGPGLWLCMDSARSLMRLS